MSNVDELLKELMNGEISTVSELKLRNENIQKKINVKRLKRLQREQNKKSKLLFPTELAIPFNPYSGKEDEDYNRDNKFRPLISQSSLMKALKTFCDKEENAGVKQIYMDKAGVSEWDTSNHEVLTEQDAMVFKRYRVPRIFTLPVIKINLPSMTRSPYGREYMISVQRDKLTGAIQGEMPIPLQINKLQQDLCYQAVKQLEEDIKSGKEVLNEKDKKERIKKIYEDVVVSQDYPLNYCIAYEIPLNTSYQIDTNKTQISGLEDEDIFNNMKLVKVTKEIQNALNKYLSGEYAAIDEYNDFWELDMSCPNEEDKMLLGKDTRYEKAMVSLSRVEGSEDLIKSLSKYIDAEKDMEKIFMGSAYVSKFTPELEPILLDAITEVISLQDPRFTASVIKANSGIIQQIFTDDAEELLADAGCGLIEEGVLDEKESAQLGKDFTDALQSIEDVTSEVELDEMELDMEE